MCSFKRTSKCDSQSPCRKRYVRVFVGLRSKRRITNGTLSHTYASLEKKIKISIYYQVNRSAQISYFYWNIVFIRPSIKNVSSRVSKSNKLQINNTTHLLHLLVPYKYICKKDDNTPPLLHVCNTYNICEICTYKVTLRFSIIGDALEIVYTPSISYCCIVVTGNSFIIRAM